MSSRFSTRALSRSASSSMVCSRMRVSSGPKSSWSDRRLDDAALIEASGVRRSWLTAASSAERSWLARASESASAASAWRRSLSRAVASWAAKAARMSRSSAGQARARRRTSTSGPVSGMASEPSSGVAGGPDPAEATVVHGGCRPVASPPGRRRPQDGRRLLAEGDDQLVEQARERVALGRDQAAGHPGQHAGVGAGLDGRGRPAGGDVDQHADDAGGDEEHHQGQDVAGVGDGEGVDRRGEVVVRQKEPGDGGQDPRPHATGGRHDHHQHQVGAERGGQVGVGPAEVRTTVRSGKPITPISTAATRRRADSGDSSRRRRRRPAAGAAAAGRRRRGPSARPSASSRVGRVGGDDVDVEGAAGGPDDRVDDRAADELGQPAPVGGARGRAGWRSRPGPPGPGRAPRRRPTTST